MCIETVIITAGLYAFPRALSRFCTQGDSQDSRIQRLRNRLAFVVDKARYQAGSRQWQLLTDVLADNAWVSFLTVSYVVDWKWRVALAAQPLNTAHVFLAFCGVAWLVRFTIYKNCPSLRRYVWLRYV